MLEREKGGRHAGIQEVVKFKNKYFRNSRVFPDTGMEAARHTLERGLLVGRLT